MYGSPAYDSSPGGPQVSFGAKLVDPRVEFEFMFQDCTGDPNRGDTTTMHACTSGADDVTTAASQAAASGQRHS